MHSYTCAYTHTLPELGAAVLPSGGMATTGGGARVRGLSTAALPGMPAHMCVCVCACVCALVCVCTSALVCHTRAEVGIGSMCVCVCVCAHSCALVCVCVY